jgi:hypothetical protein
MQKEVVIGSEEKIYNQKEQKICMDYNNQALQGSSFCYLSN